jgi:hypothetical protein
MAEGVGLCRPCGSVFRLAELADDQEFAAVDPRVRVAGCEVARTARETVLSARAFSVGNLVALMAMSAFWNGLVSIFVVMNVAATIGVVTGSMPAWAADIKIQGAKGPPSLGFVIFVWAFLTPFIAIGVVFLVTTLHVAFGSVRLVGRGDSWEAIVGIGPWGWKRRFLARDVTRVSMDVAMHQGTRKQKLLLRIDADRPIRLGSMVPEPRVRWLAASMREELARSGRP